MATKSSIPTDFDHLQRFSYRHMNYIGQMLGDITTREVITEVYDKKTWTLATEQDDHYGAHHFCRRINRTAKQGGDMRWCSVGEGIQCIDRNPTDVLCQSYSILKYMNEIKPSDKKLTKELQMRMIKTWRRILRKKDVREQIMDSSKQVTSESTPLWTDHTPSDQTAQPIQRGDKVVDAIRKILNEWESYGWRYFLLRKNELPVATLKYLMHEK